ncbi:hypothetical protein KVJ62_07040 [Helicobacter pylori]|nr:hypothetical protein KVJ62_07040 [Helicobacter pylori]
MRQNNETEKSFNELKEITQAIQEQKRANSNARMQNSVKPPTKEPKKSV